MLASRFRDNLSRDTGSFSKWWTPGWLTCNGKPKGNQPVFHALRNDHRGLKFWDSLTNIKRMHVHQLCLAEIHANLQWPPSVRRMSRRVRTVTENPRQLAKPSHKARRSEESSLKELGSDVSLFSTKQISSWLADTPRLSTFHMIGAAFPSGTSLGASPTQKETKTFLHFLFKCLACWLRDILQSSQAAKGVRQLRQFIGIPWRSRTATNANSQPSVSPGSSWHTRKEIKSPQRVHQAQPALSCPTPVALMCHIPAACSKPAQASRCQSSQEDAASDFHWPAALSGKSIDPSLPADSSSHWPTFASLAWPPCVLA